MVPRMLVHAAGLQPMPSAGPPPAPLAPPAVLGACRGLQAPTQVGWLGLDHTAPSWHEGVGGRGEPKKCPMGQQERPGDPRVSQACLIPSLTSPIRTIHSFTLA